MREDNKQAFHQKTEELIVLASLDEKVRALPNSQDTRGKCDHCQQRRENKSLLVCTRCNVDQYCSKVAQIDSNTNLP